MAVEEKWKANLEKVAFMKQFPGLLRNWGALREKPSRLLSRSRGNRERQCWCAPMAPLPSFPRWRRSPTSWAR